MIAEGAFDAVVRAAVGAEFGEDLGLEGGGKERGGEELHGVEDFGDGVEFVGVRVGDELELFLGADAGVVEADGDEAVVGVFELCGGG